MALHFDNDSSFLKLFLSSDHGLLVFLGFLLQTFAKFWQKRGSNGCVHAWMDACDVSSYSCFVFDLISWGVTTTFQVIWYVCYFYYSVWSNMVFYFDTIINSCVLICWSIWPSTMWACMYVSICVSLSLLMYVVVVCSDLYVSSWMKIVF